MDGEAVDTRRRWADWLPDVEVLGWTGAALWMLDIVAAATHVLDTWWVIALNVLAACAFLAWGVIDALAHGLDDDNAVVAFGGPAFVVALYAALAAWPNLTGVGVAVASAAYLVVALVCAAVVGGERRPDGSIDWHLIPHSLRRRRPLFMWSNERVLAHVRRAYVGTWGDVSDPEAFSGVRALVVFHHQPDLLPKWVPSGAGFDPWVVLSYLADDHNLVSWRLGVVEDMHEGSEGFATEGEALRRAADVAAERELAEVAVSEMPALVRAAAIQSLTGRQPPRDDW